MFTVVPAAVTDKHRRRGISVAARVNLGLVRQRLQV
jgi:hypothetical protein